MRAAVDTAEPITLPSSEDSEQLPEEEPQINSPDDEPARPDATEDKVTGKTHISSQGMTEE